MDRVAPQSEAHHRFREWERHQHHPRALRRQHLETELGVTAIRAVMGLHWEAQGHHS